KERRVDPQRVSRRTGQSLNVKRLASFRIARNSGNIIRSENKNITTMRLDEVVGELVHKDLIARIDRTARDDLAAAISVSRKNIEIVPQCFRRHVNQKLLVLTNETRESEEKEKLFLLYLQDLIVLARDDVDVISAAHHEFSDLLKKIRQRDCRFYFVTDDPVERRLHRTG